MKQKNTEPMDSQNPSQQQSPSSSSGSSESRSSAPLRSGGQIDMQFATAMDRVTQPSPDAARMARYAECPVSPALGTADISIPIHEVSSGRLRVPVGLRYCTSGIKVNDVSGLTGLGWHLEAGGVITRTVCGGPDALQGTQPVQEPITVTPLPNGDHLNAIDGGIAGRLSDIASGVYDSDFDRYAFNFLGHTGEFIIRDGAVVTLTPTDLTITQGNGVFTIYDTAGNRYVFGAQETSSKSFTITSPTPLAPSNTCGMGYWTGTPTAWYLTRIETMNGEDSILLVYDNDAAGSGSYTPVLSPFTTERPSQHKTYTFAYKYFKNGTNHHHWKSVQPSGILYSAGDVPDIAHGDWQYIVSEGYSPRALTSIVFRGGRVDFSYSPSIVTSANNVRRSYFQNLTGIAVKDAGGRTIRTAALSYTATGDQRTLLTSVVFRGTDNAVTDSRTMTYYSPTTMMTTNSQDLFGYYNARSNSTLVPFALFPDNYTINENVGDRSYSASAAQCLSLKSIETASGARTTILYEGNSVQGMTGTVLQTIGIGIRVFRIITSDCDRTVRTRTFSYYDSVLNIPVSLFTHDRFVHSSECSLKLDTTAHATWEGLYGPERQCSVTISDQSCADGAPLESAVIVHGRVCETVSDPDSGAWCRTEYTFDTAACMKPTAAGNVSAPSDAHDDEFAANHSYGFHLLQRIPECITRLSDSLPASVKLTEPSTIFVEGACPMLTMPLTVRRYARNDGESEHLVEEVTNTYETATEQVRTGLSAKKLLSVMTNDYDFQEYWCADDYRQVVHNTRKAHSRLVRTVTKTWGDDPSDGPVTQTTVVYYYQGGGIGLSPSWTGYIGNRQAISAVPAMGDTLAPIIVETIPENGSGRRYVKVFSYVAASYPSTAEAYLIDLAAKHFRGCVGESITVMETSEDPNTHAMTVTTTQTDHRKIEYGWMDASGTDADNNHIERHMLLPVRETTSRNNGTAVVEMEVRAYDIHGNPTTVKQRGKPLTEYGWSEDCRGLYPTSEKMTDADGLFPSLETTRTYELLVGPSTETDPAGLRRSFTYDGAGRLATERRRGAGASGNGEPVSACSYDFLRSDGTTNSVTQRTFNDNTGSASASRTTVTRYDGLGRTVQSSLVGAATGGGDIVQPSAPDFLDREDAVEYLPCFLATSEGGAYRSDLASVQERYYDARYGTGSGALASTRRDYEASQSGRVRSVLIPGMSGDSRKTVTTVHPSGPAEVPHITADDASDPASLSRNGNHPAGSFVKTVTSSPDGAVAEVFSNEFGSPVLERRLISGTPGSSSDAPVWSSTYYVRDVRDRVVCVVPPDVCDALLQSQQGSSDVSKCYVYTHDDRDRVVSKKLPGAQRTEYTYDDEDRVTAEKTGNRIFGNVYDRFGRLTKRTFRYGESGTPITLAEYGYDSYSASVGVTLPAFASVSGVVTSRITQPKGLKTWERLRVLAPGEAEGSMASDASAAFVTRAFYYDSLERPVQTAETNHLGRTSRTSTKYSYTGEPTLIRETEAAGASLSVTADTAMTYDSWGRMTSVNIGCGVGTDGPDGQASALFIHDRLGRLVSKVLGYGLASPTTVGDSFTIQGWLSRRQSQHWTEELAYGSPAHAATPAAPGLTGNITEWKTYRNSTGANPQTYAFAYDRLLRLTGSERYLGSSETPSGTLIEEDIVYDACGRILSMTRVGATGSDVQDLSFDPDDDTRDIYGNITYDAATGTHIEWNIINLPRKITSSDGIVSEYTYLADGTKVKVCSSAQGALHYLGAMVFEAATPDGAPSFESLAFSDGRIVAGRHNEARYHVTDHLGSVRAVVKPDGTVAAEHDYYPYGKRITAGSATTMTTALRHTFSGKEDQGHTPARAPYLDFGARLYSADAGRWLSQDPLADKYYSISPYSYCAGNPVNLVDPEGQNPIYSTNGDFLGTDDMGLKGMFIVMSEDLFAQGMSHSDAEDSAFTGPLSRKASKAIKKHHRSLWKRPDYDGVVTIKEGIKWAHDHPGAKDNPNANNVLYIDVSKVDFGSLTTSDLGLKDGEQRPVNLYDYVQLNFRSLNSTYALGNTQIQMIDSELGLVNLVEDTYDWDYHSPKKFQVIPQSSRDWLIMLERMRAKVGDKHGFQLRFYGTGKLKE